MEGLGQSAGGRLKSRRLEIEAGEILKASWEIFAL
jgi:hypothetical protein